MLLLFVAWNLGNVARAQVHLPCGTTLTQSLAAGETDQYEFTVASGDAVAIDVTDISGTIGPINMQLLGPDNPVTPVNGTGTCSGGIALNLTGGSYLLKVSECPGQSSGDYAIRLNSVSKGFNGGPNCGSDVSHTTTQLEPGAVDAYQITTGTGQLNVNATVDTPEGTPLEIRVYSPTGVLLDDICESQPEVEVRVSPGVQTVLVNTCSGATAVKYEIEISSDSAPPTRTPTPTSTASPTATFVFVTATPSPTPTRSATRTPSSTRTPVPTLTSTSSPVPSFSPTPTSSVTSTPTSSTPSPVPTATDTSTPVPSFSPTPTQSATGTPSFTSTPVPTSTSTASPTPSCVGDCNGNGTVTVDEVILAVNIALDNEPVSACLAADANHDGRITVDEILLAVTDALNGCPVKP